MQEHDTSWVYIFLSLTLFCSNNLKPASSVFLSHHSSSSLQPPASQQYFSLTPLQHQHSEQGLHLQVKEEEDLVVCVVRGEGGPLL